MVLELWCRDWDTCCQAAGHLWYNLYAHPQLLVALGESGDAINIWDRVHALSSDTGSRGYYHTVQGQGRHNKIMSCNPIQS